MIIILISGCIFFAHAQPSITSSIPVSPVTTFSSTDSLPTVSISLDSFRTTPPANNPTQDTHTELKPDATISSGTIATVSGIFAAVIILASFGIYIFRKYETPPTEKFKHRLDKQESPGTGSELPYLEVYIQPERIPLPQVQTFYDVEGRAIHKASIGPPLQNVANHQTIPNYYEPCMMPNTRDIRDRS
jgi:hypothetical protein